MTLIDGKALADVWLVNIAEQVHALGVAPHLAAVCVGDDAGLRSFVKLKQKAAQSIGIQFSSYFFDANDEDGVRQTLQYLAGDETVDGIFIELPLPNNWNTEKILELIPPEKDVDALTTSARLPAGRQVPAPAVRALDYVLQEYNVITKGISAAIVGHGQLVGKPIAQWLNKQGANVSVVDVDTKNPTVITAQADLVVSGVGKSGLIHEDWIKDDATVIDFGYENGKGDVDAKSVQKKAGLLSPVPGGMGPLVIAAVLENLVTLSTS